MFEHVNVVLSAEIATWVVTKSGDSVTLHLNWELHLRHLDICPQPQQ